MITTSILIITTIISSSVCPLGGFTGARESLISNGRGVPQGCPQGQTLRALLLRGTSVLH